MKKIIAIFLLLIIGTTLCSCSFGKNGIVATDNDQKKSNSLFENVLDALQSKDKEMLVGLFSKNVYEDIEKTHKSLEDIMDYFAGKVESYNDWDGPFVETTEEYDDIIQIMESTYDVKTTECDYRFAIKCVIQDTANPNNVGIHSLYIIKLSDDTHKEYAYWGDGKYTPGINIGVPNVI